ncbi:DUF1837 domain-containing protein [Winogradskyella psychrotolerans]|uniref:Hachiman antiphage defense system protein HamA n=1 Tax=Winogradskyella psychrotolerans TaxID=1344585 RepID=UPI001C06A47F|nr:Hachiman antiphage defense system protein HamA [Winogradskyella psychrotolerans]MBU2921140.1 DUF1837 domain-containing protein [Winogradskyella psychrotolerans]
MINKDLFKIDKSWMEKELISHLTEKIGDKVSMRVYTVKPSSTQMDFISLSNFLTRIIPHYVYSIKEIEDDIERQLRRNEKAIRKSNAELDEHELIEIIVKEKERVKNETWIDIFNQSRIFFKKKGEDYIGGKYGELMLFALVEGVLECKMVAHKIKHLTNVNDEIKGSDGVFLGNYNENKAILFGESKIMQSMSGAIVDALESINRYHNNSERAHNIDHELLIAREHIHKYNVDDIDDLYERLDPTSEDYKEQLLVHPIILMYERSFIKNIQKKAKTYEEFNEMISIELTNRLKRKQEVFDLVNKHVIEQKLEHSFLDFFLIPVDDVSKFRGAMDDKLL